MINDLQSGLDFTPDFSLLATVQGKDCFIENYGSICQISGDEWKEEINGVVVSANGKEIATLHHNRKIISIYSNDLPNSCDLINEIYEHKSSFVRAMQYSKSGKLFASADFSKIHIWTLKEQIRQKKYTLEVPSLYLLRLICFSENRLEVLTSSLRSVIVYQLSEEKKIFRGFLDNKVTAVASRRSSFLIGTEKGTVSVVSNKKSFLTNINLDAPISALVSHLGLILVGTEENKIYLCRKKHEGNEVLYENTSLNMGEYLYRTGRKISLIAGEYLYKAERFYDAIVTIKHAGSGSIVVNGQNLTFCSSDEDVNSKPLEKIDNGVCSCPDSLACSCILKKQCERITAELDETITSMDYSSKAKSFALGLEAKIALWFGEEHTRPTYLEGHRDQVTGLAYTPDGKNLISGSKDKTVRLWSNDLVHSCILGEHDNWITSVACNPNNKEVASASYDSTVKIWSIDSEKLVRSLSGHLGAVLDVTYSPDGYSLASAGKDKKISVWFHSENKVLTGHTEEVTSLAYSPDNTTLASGSADKTIKIWNTKQGILLRTLTGHKTCISCLIYSPDGRRLVSGSFDSSFYDWLDHSTTPDLESALQRQSWTKFKKTAADLEVKFRKGSHQREIDAARQNRKELPMMCFMVITASVLMNKEEPSVQDHRGVFTSLLDFFSKAFKGG